MKTVKIDEKIDVLFFERPVSDLKRYAFKIAKFLKEIDPKIKMASISLELPEDESEKCVDYYILRKQVKNIDQFLLRHSSFLLIDEYSEKLKKLLIFRAFQSTYPQAL